METKFEISSDLEFYCFLKAHLPNEYEIVSWPDPSYYSEWQYHYVIYRQGEQFKEYKGSFKEVEENHLVEEAHQILESTR